MPSNERDDDTPQETIHAVDEDECLLWVPALNENGPMHTTVPVLVNPLDVPLGEDEAAHLVEIPVCSAHYEALEQYKSGRTVEEVRV